MYIIKVIVYLVYNNINSKYFDFFAGEKNSHSEDSDEEGTETVESDKAENSPKTDGGDGDAGVEDDKSKSSPRELRKRKPRKAD